MHRKKKSSGLLTFLPIHWDFSIKKLKKFGCHHTVINFASQRTFKKKNKVLLNMKEQSEYLADIKEIRNLMEHSARFISLNALSSMIVGTIAAAGALAAYLHAPFLIEGHTPGTGNMPVPVHNMPAAVSFYIIDALLVLIFALTASILLTIRQARKNNTPVWNKTMKQLLFHFLIPLSAGGILCIAAMTNGYYGWVAPVTLIFYGLGLFAASKYTMPGIRYLGMTEITIGLISAFFIGHGFLFWVAGFGIIHILYGICHFFVYEKKSN
jgi:hypothetical protein